MEYQTTIASYLTLSLVFTVSLHRALKNNGRVFVDELFVGNPAAGRALERLLDIGYVLLNVGYVAVAAAIFPAWRNDGDPTPAIRGIAAAMGSQMLILSVAHGVNVWLFSRKVGRAMRANQRELEELLRS
jgi:peptidoglycan/LPS O-acetylase OafA/YrhL